MFVTTGKTQLNKHQRALALLSGFVTADGELGYAWGGKDTDRPLIDLMEDEGWIRWKRDASTDTMKGYQRRDIYQITDAGRRALKAGLPALANMVPAPRWLALYLAQLPAGTEIITFQGRMCFAHPDHPVRWINENGELEAVPLDTLRDEGVRRMRATHSHSARSKKP